MRESYEEPGRSSFTWQPQPPPTRSFTQPAAAAGASPSVREIPVFRHPTADKSQQQPPGWGWAGPPVQPSPEPVSSKYCSTANITPTYGGKGTGSQVVTEIPVFSVESDVDVNPVNPDASLSRTTFSSQQPVGNTESQTGGGSGVGMEQFSEVGEVPVCHEIPVLVRNVPIERGATNGNDVPDGSRAIPVREVPLVYEPPAEESSSDQVESQGEEPLESKSRDSSDGGLRVEPPRRGRSPSPAPPNTTPLEQIDLILTEAEKQKKEVDKFDGTKQDKQYLIIEEMLTRLLIKLDRIDSEGKEEIRNARRLGVKQVQAALDLLESKGKESKSAAQSGGDQPKSNDDDGSEKSGLEAAAAVKEMTLSSEVPC